MNEIAPDEPGTACNKYFHYSLTLIYEVILSLG